MDKSIKLTAIVMCVLLLTGCWDKIEIEERSFVYGIAIDLSENHTDENTDIKLTQQFVIPENISTTGNSGGAGSPYQNIIGTGSTVFEVNRKVMREENLKTDVTHLKVVLFSEEMAKIPMLYEEMLDVFLREKDMRRGIKTAITSGNAEEYLTVAPENEKIPAEYINGLLDNPQKFEVLDLVVIGDLQEMMFNEESIPLPLLNIKKVKDEKLIDYEGVAVYHGKQHKIVGNLKGDAVKGLSFIRGKKNTGTINFKMEKKTSTFEILQLKSRISLENKDINHLKFTVNVEIQGTLAEQSGSADLLDKVVVKKLEEAIKKRAEYKMEEAIQRLQNDLQTDVIGTGTYLSHFHPKIWKEVKDNWDFGENYFSKSEIKAKVKITISKPGSINKTK